MANKVSDSVAVPGKQSRNERIEEFLREHYAFRYNTVKSRAEFRSTAAFDTMHTTSLTPPMILISSRYTSFLGIP